MPRSARGQQAMPACSYGSGCTRKGCIYKHPPKPKTCIPKRSGGAAAAVPAEQKSGRVCVAFLAGRCTFGRGCHDDHPAPADAAKLRQQVCAAKRPVPFLFSVYTRSVCPSLVRPGACVGWLFPRRVVG